MVAGVGTEDTGVSLEDLIEHSMALRAPLAQAGGVLAIDRILAARRDLTRDDRDLLDWWRDDAVRGIFEVRAAEAGAAGAAGAGAGAAAAEDTVIILNLVDDLEYRVYRFASRVEPGMFASGALLPL